jgi:hypothetical protein
MLCSCKLRLRRASPTVGLPSSHRVLLGLRRLYAGGAKTDSYRCRVACLFFSAARRQKRKKGLGGSPNSFSVAASYASAGQARRYAYPAAIEYFLASVDFMPAGPRLTATGAVLRVCFFPPQGGRRDEEAWEDRRIHAL